jgi:hypothetical protein
MMAPARRYELWNLRELSNEDESVDKGPIDDHIIVPTEELLIRFPSASLLHFILLDLLLESINAASLP